MMNTTHATNLPLSALQRNDTARIERIEGEQPIIQRLMAMGLLTGKIVKVVRIAPLDDPIAVESEGQIISLRRRDATDVIVTRLES